MRNHKGIPTLWVNAPVIVCLERPSLAQTQKLRLCIGQFGQMSIECGQMQTGHIFVCSAMEEEQSVGNGGLGTAKSDLPIFFGSKYTSDL